MPRARVGPCVQTAFQAGQARPERPSSQLHFADATYVRASTALFEALASIARTTSLMGELVATVAGGSVRAAPFRAAAASRNSAHEEHDVAGDRPLERPVTNARRSITT